MSAATLRPASDSDLLRHGAAGHENSYDELEARHRAALAAYTQQLTGDSVAADLLVERSFAELRERAAADPDQVGAVRPFLLARASSLHGVTSDAPPPAIRWDSLDSVSQTALWHLDVEGDTEEIVSLLVGIDVEYVPAVAAAARYAVGDMPSGASADLRQRLTSYLLGSAAEHFLETHGSKPATAEVAQDEAVEANDEENDEENDEAETPAAPVLTLVRSPEPETSDLEASDAAAARPATELALAPEPVTTPAATVATVAATGAPEVRRPDPLSDPLNDPLTDPMTDSLKTGASLEAAPAEVAPVVEAPVVEAPVAAEPLAPAAAVQAAFDAVRPKLPVRHPDDFSDLMEVALGKSAAASAAASTTASTTAGPAEVEHPAAVEPEFTPLDEPEPIKLVAPYPLNVPARSFRYAGEVYDDLADEDTIIHPLDSPKSDVVEISSRRRTALLLAVPLAIAGVLVVVGVASAALLLSSPPTPARLDSVSSGTDGEAGVWALVPGQTLKARQAKHKEPAYTPSSSPTSGPTSPATSAAPSESPSASASQTSVQSSWPTPSHSPSHSPSPTHSTSPTTSPTPTPTQSPNPSDSPTSSPSSSSSPTASNSATTH